MKTKFLKMVLPISILMLAVVSAFAFKNVEEKALLGPEKGWLIIPGNPCSIEVDCDNSPNPAICTGVFGGMEYVARGKEHPTGPCVKVLYRLF